MQQAHRTMRHADGRIGRPETVPFDKQALQRAIRNDPLDATLPGVAVDPSLPLILTTRRERLVLKHPSEFDLRAPAQDRTLARLLIACTAVAVAAIVFAAAPSLDVRSLLNLRQPSSTSAAVKHVAPAAKSVATLRSTHVTTERVVTPPVHASIAATQLPAASVTSVPAPTQSLAPPSVPVEEVSSSAVAALAPADKPSETKARSANKSSALATRTKRAKRKPRAGRHPR